MNLNPESNSEQNSELSEYTRQLISDTKKILDNTFSFEKERTEFDESEIADEAIIRSFIRTCAVFALSEMDMEERKNFIEQKPDALAIIKLALEKSPLSEEERKIMEKEFEKISQNDLTSPTDMLFKLNLLNSESLMRRFKQHLYKSIAQNSENSEAYTYLHLTDEAH